MRPFRPLVPLLLLLLAGCAPPGPRAAGVVRPVPPGMARIVFYRELSYYDSTGMPTLYLNGAPAGVSELGTALYRDVPPGRYDATIGPTRPYPHQFKTVVLRPGEVFYFRIDTLPKPACLIPAEPCVADTFILTPVDPATGYNAAQALRPIAEASATS